jgi:hypothetical protein
MEGIGLNFNVNIDILYDKDDPYRYKTHKYETTSENYVE